MVASRQQGFVRNKLVPNWSDGEADVAVNNRGDQCVVQGLPERADLVRLGNSYGAQIPTGSAFTFVNAWPTTRAELVLFNGEPVGGLIYVIDRVWLANITSQAAAQPYSLLGQLVPNTPALTAPANNTGILKQSLSGNRSGYGGRAALALANTSFCVANQWFPLGDAVMSPMTTNLGGSMEAVIYGKYLVAPGAVFGLAGLAGTAAGTAICGIEWHEVQLTIAP